MAHERDPDRPRERPPAAGRAAARARIDQQPTWVEWQLQRAVERGDFDDLPGYGRPLADLSPDRLAAAHDPDWWVRRLVEREQISGVLPAALQLRKDDADLDARLDALSRESDVRREVEDFNERVRAAFYQPLGGPPLITKQRDVDAEVARWHERRRAEAEATSRGKPSLLDGHFGREVASSPARRGIRRRWRRPPKPQVE